MPEPLDDIDRLGQALVRENLITEGKLADARAMADRDHLGLPLALVKGGFVDEKSLTVLMGREQGLEVVDVEELILPENLIKRLPRKIIEKHTVLPIEYRDGMLVVAVSDPYDMVALDEIQMALDARVQINLAARSSIKKVINGHFHAEEAAKKRDQQAAAAAAAGPAIPAGGTSPTDLAADILALLVQRGLVNAEDLAARMRDRGLLK